MPSVRLLPFASVSGARNMALDEALLHSAAERGVASLRFYTWSEPTLTLGYFQPAADRRANDRLAALAWVRRATGGAAIVHDPGHEITYSLALPAGRDWQAPGESWICRMHYVVRDALSTLGVTSRAVVCGEERKLGPVLCFLHQTPGDLSVDVAKVVGSAQRKHRGAIVQHGSLLLSRSPFAPELPGVAELTGVTLTKKQVMAAVTQQFETDTAWQLDPGDWTDAELADADRILADRYASPVWNEKR